MADKGNRDTQKSSVKIRFKAMKDGYRSIYLDCYHDSRRSYEYLKLHLVPETDEEAVRQKCRHHAESGGDSQEAVARIEKLPTTSKRLAETQDSVSKADITLQEWLARFKEIQKAVAYVTFTR